MNMKNVKTAAAALLAAALLAGCGAKNPAASSAPAQDASSASAQDASSAVVLTGFASAPGFPSHGDIVYASVTVDGNGKPLTIDLDEYYGIRSIGRVINNLEKATDADNEKLASIPEEDLVYGESGKYVGYKYLMIDNRIFECVDPDNNLYKEIGDGASIEDLQAYANENTDWWCDAMEHAAETGAVLKVAGEGDDVVAEADGVKLAKMSDLSSFYGCLKKSEGYTANFSAAGTTDAWKNSRDTLVDYMLTNGVTDELVEAANSEDTKAYLDLVSGATFGYPSIYVNIVEQAIANAK